MLQRTRVMQELNNFDHQRISSIVVDRVVRVIEPYRIRVTSRVRTCILATNDLAKRRRCRKYSNAAS